MSPYRTDFFTKRTVEQFCNSILVQPMTITLLHKYLIHCGACFPPSPQKKRIKDWPFIQVALIIIPLFNLFCDNTGPH